MSEKFKCKSVNNLFNVDSLSFFLVEHLFDFSLIMIIMMNSYHSISIIALLYLNLSFLESSCLKNSKIMLHFIKFDSYYEKLSFLPHSCNNICFLIIISLIQRMQNSIIRDIQQSQQH